MTMTYKYPHFDWQTSWHADGEGAYLLLADGESRLPHGGSCRIVIRPSDKWGEMRTFNGTPGSVRYSCVPPGRLAEACEDAIQWAKRKFREHVRSGRGL